MFLGLTNAIFTGGTFVHTVQGKPGLLGEGFKILHKHIAPGAMHNSGDLFDQPKCHPKTRLTVLSIIMQWIQDQSSSSMLWLHGATGSGKTAIARSIAEHCEELGILLATFFFSRAVDDCDNTKQFVSTIAYQLAQTVPDTLQYIERAVEKDPSIFDKTLKHQVQTLVVHPLKLSSNNLPKSSSLPLLNPHTPSLFIIDGLDECDDPLSHIQVLKILGSLILHYDLPLKILLTSRPERHIRSAFETGSLSNVSSKLALDQDDSNEDIRLFLSSEFDDIKQSHPFRSTIPDSGPWPCASILQSLVKKSAGQFRFAAAVIKFVASFDHFPHERLEDLLAFCDDYTLDQLLEILLFDKRPSSNLPNSHVSEPSTSCTSAWASSSDNINAFIPLRRRSASPFPSQLSNSTIKQSQRASSEPIFDRSTEFHNPSPTSRRSSVKQQRQHSYSCPVPSCGATFTRHLNFKIHLRTHKQAKKPRHSLPTASCSPDSVRMFVNHLDRKRHARVLPSSDQSYSRSISFRCVGCRREFPGSDSLDRHLKSEIGMQCMKAIESRKVRDVAVPSTTNMNNDCWEMDMDMDMDMEVDKGIGSPREMEVD